MFNIDAAKGNFRLTSHIRDHGFFIENVQYAISRGESALQCAAQIGKCDYRAK